MVTPQPLKPYSSLTIIIVFVRWILPLFAAFSQFSIYSKFPNDVVGQAHSLWYGQPLAIMLWSFDRQPWPHPLSLPPTLPLLTHAAGQ